MKSSFARFLTKSAESYYRDGRLQLKRGNLALAIVSYSNAIAQNPYDAFSYDNRGVVHGLLGYHELALADATKACELLPDQGGFVGNLARAFATLSELQNALDTLNVALRLNPSHANNWALRAHTRWMLKDYAGSFTDYTRAIELRPDDAGTYLCRATVRQDGGDVTGAISDFTRAVEINAASASAYCGRARQHITNRDLDLALSDLDAAIQHGPHVGYSYNLRAYAYAEKGNPERAFADYERANLLDPAHADPRGCGWAAVQLGNHKLAIENYSAFLTTNPGRGDIYCARGESFHALNETESALADFNTAVALDANDARALYSRAILAFAQGDLRSSIADLDRCLALRPEFAGAHLGRAICLERSGAPADDISQAYERYIALMKPPATEPEFHNRAWAPFMVGRASEALPDIDKAVALNPDDANVLGSRGHILEAAGRKDESIASFYKALGNNPEPYVITRAHAALARMGVDAPRKSALRRSRCYFVRSWISVFANRPETRS